jgi:membrane protease YdiL (CAAX protease family)
VERNSAAAPAGFVASRTHLAVLSAILLGIAAVGYLALSHPAAGTGSVAGAALYLPLLAAEWALFLYMRMGMKRRGVAIADLISARPLSLRTMLIDMLLGLALLGLWLAVEYLFDGLAGAPSSPAVQRLLVRNIADVPLWVALALSAGFVEELVFRGYMQRQFAALLRRPLWGVAAQAVLFGVTHGYQGALPVLRITVFGLIFGFAAFGRRSLVPGMVAHAAVDVIGGLAALR